MWSEKLKINPIGLLLSSENPALILLTERDLLDNTSINIMDLWKLPEPTYLIAQQKMDGSWQYKGKRPGDELGENYELLEAWRNLRILIEMYGFDHRHPAVERAAEYIFSCQTNEGDIRGILSNQYMPYYTGAILELLIKAGFENDARILEGINWLLDMRQKDGGWIVPMTMFKMQEFYSLCQKEPIPPEKNRPFSHMASGMVIRCFAAHPEFRKSKAAIQAGELLKNRFFQEDVYSSRKSKEYWFKFQFPFWWTDVLTVMDSLMRLGFSANDLDIQKGLDWFLEHQDTNGLWKSYYGKSKNKESDLWITYAVCRVLKYFLK